MKEKRWTMRKPAFYLLAVVSLAVVGGFIATKPVLGVESESEKASIATLRQMGDTFAAIAETASEAVVSVRVSREMPQMNRQIPEQFRGQLPDMLERFFGAPGPESRQRSPRGGMRPFGQGSGFVITKDGYIVTNSHVVANGADVEVTVQFKDGREYDATVVGADESTDVAVLKIDANNLDTLPLGDSDDVRVGEWVLAIGAPFGLSHSVTAGIVSARGRGNVGIVDYADFIQTDAAINPGNSGGPLLNLDGEVIGLNSAILSRTGGNLGIGFAIPVNMVQYITDQLREDGTVSRGFLGVQIQNLDQNLSDWFGAAEGVLVASVTPDSPAEKAGLQRDDIITEYNGQPVTEMGSFRSRVATTPPGTRVEITIVRDGKNLQKRVTIGEMEDGEVVTADRGNGRTAEPIGLTVQNLTGDVAERLGLEGEEGVVVTKVEPGSKSAIAGLEPGMLIQEINRERVKNVKEFSEALEKADKDKTMLLLVTDGEGTWYVALD